MGICLEFVFLQIFKSRSGPRTEFNNNFSGRAGPGTDLIFPKAHWDFLFLLEVAALDGNFLGARPKLERDKSSEHESEGYGREKVLSLIPELSIQESWSVERIPESGPSNPVLLQLLAPLGWPSIPHLPGPRLLPLPSREDPAGHMQRYEPGKLTRDRSPLCSQKTLPLAQQLNSFLGCPSWAQNLLTLPPLFQASDWMEDGEGRE